MKLLKKISPLENTLKNSGDSQIIKNNDSTSKPKFTGPSREEGAVEGLVLTTNSKNNLRTSSEGLSSLKSNTETNETDLNIKGNNIKAIDSISKNLQGYRDWETDRKSTRLNSSHITRSRMPSSA